MKFALTSILLLIFPSICFGGTPYRSYGYYHQPTIVKQKVVEFDADYFLGLKGYVIAGQKAEHNSHERDKVRDEALLEALKALNKVLEGGVTAGGQMPVNPESPAPIPEPQQPSAESGTELDRKALAIFFRDCKTCHFDSKESGGVKLGETYTRDGKEFARLFIEEDECRELAKRNLIHDSVNGVGLADRGKKLMPMSGDKLSDEDVETLRLWSLEKAEAIFKK